MDTEGAGQTTMRLELAIADRPGSMQRIAHSLWDRNIRIDQWYVYRHAERQEYVHRIVLTGDVGRIRRVVERLRRQGDILLLRVLSEAELDR